jgi:hypothetical protein
MITNPIWQIAALLAVHWVADFVLQTHWQATNKSKRSDALAAHIATYYGALLVASCVIFFGAPFSLILAFAVINGAAHFATDYVTSRITSRLWAQQRWHDFFVVVGLDQLIHHLTLIVTMWLFFA